MKRHVIAVLATTSVFAALVACGTDTTTTVTVCPDAGPPDTGPAAVVDAGQDVLVPFDAGPDASGQYAPSTTTLRKIGATDAYWLVGITSGATPHAIYYTQTQTNFALKAVPVAGGPEVVLDPDLDPFVTNDAKALVVGGAVSWAHAGDTNDIAPALFVWTAENGVKTINTKSLLTQFWATEDGKLIAFSANATAQATTDIVVTTSAAPDITNPVLTGVNAENITVNTDACPTEFGFTGTTFIASYCTGMLTTATQEQLVTVDTSATPFVATVRIANTNPADAYDGNFYTDSKGKNLFVVDKTFQGRLVATNGTTTTIASIGSVNDDFRVTPDGTYLLFRDNASTLKRATFEATPVITSLGANIRELLQISRDSKLALYATSYSNGVGDINALDLTSATPNPTPVALVPSPTTALQGFTGDGLRAVYFEGNADGTVRLSTVALTGGTPLLLQASTNSALVAQQGAGVLTLFNETPILHSLTATRIDVSYIDSSKGGLPEQPDTSVLDAQDVFTVTGKTFVYRDVGANPAIYALDMP